MENSLEERQNKVLVVGSVEGKYSKLFKRVRDVNLKAGPFDLLICVGDFFGTNPDFYDELVNGSMDLPSVSTYVLGRFPKEFRRFHSDVEDFNSGFDIVDGITYLGKSGVLTTSFGLKIAYLNGSFRTEESNDENMDYFNKKDYDNLMIQVNASGSTSSPPLIDIFLTVQWPKNILENSNNKASLEPEVLSIVDKNSSTFISQVVRRIKPRYYFVGGENIFFEREPYRNHRVLSDNPRNVTRFFSIASVMNAQKRKWIYAFNLVSGSKLSQKEITQQPENVTENPLLKVNDSSFKETTQQPEIQNEQFFFSTDSSTSGNKDDRKRKANRENITNRNDQKERKNMKIDMNDCWFCLGSSSVDKSLIVSIGEHTYLALAKGGLSDYHMLITPIEHIKSYISIENDDIRDEIKKFKESLINYFKTLNMVPVFYERNFRTAHFQINVIGIPIENAKYLEDASKSVFGRFNMKELSQEFDIQQELNERERYFILECPNYYNFLVHINTQQEFFPVQIGRELLARKELLNCPERMNWKNCSLSKDDALQLTKRIRNSFKEFDFTV